MIKRLRVTVDGQSYDVTVELDDAGAAPAPVIAAPAAAPATPAPAPAATAAPTPASAPTPAPSAAPAAASGPAGPGDVPSPLAGRVTAVVVAAGQDVKEGDHLLTLEAMKMQTTLYAPASGVVEELLAGVGDAVDGGDLLVRLRG